MPDGRFSLLKPVCNWRKSRRSVWSNYANILTLMSGSTILHCMTFLLRLPAVPRSLAWDGRRYLLSMRGTSAPLVVERFDAPPRELPFPEDAVAGLQAQLCRVTGRLHSFNFQH